MNEETKPKDNVVQGLGIASLVMGILALPLAFVPCCGMLAFVPAILGLLMAGAGIVLARVRKASGGLSTAALVVSGIAMVVVILQMILATGGMVKAAAEGQKAIQEQQKQAPK